MNCPRCGSNTKVTDTTNITSANEVYRKRKCCECSHMFYTSEFEVERDKNFAREWNEARYYRLRRRDK